MVSDQLFIKSGKRYYPIRISSLLYLHRKGSRILVVTEEGTMPTPSNFADWLHYFPQGFFLRVGPDYLIVANRIEEWKDSRLIVGGTEMKIDKAAQKLLEKHFESSSFTCNRDSRFSLWRVGRNGRLEQEKD